MLGSSLSEVLLSGVVLLQHNSVTFHYSMAKSTFRKKKRKKIDLKDVTFTATRRIEAPLISTHLYRETRTQEFKVRFTRLIIKSN